MADTENGARSEPADLRSMLAEAADEAEQAAERNREPEQLELEPAAEKPTEAGERPRGPDGKFLPKDAVDTDAAQAAAKPADEQKPEAAPKDGKTEIGDKAAPATGTAAVEAPLHWSQADKQWLASIPAEHQASVLNRFKQMEAGFTPKLQKLATYERDFQGVPELFAPHVEVLRQRGQTPAQIIQTWANVEQAFINHKGALDAGRDPGGNAAQIVARIIAGYQIAPKAVADALNAMQAQLQNGTQPNGSAGPAVARTELPPEVVARLTRLEQAENERLTAANQERLDRAGNQINTFANEKDGEGNLKHPFFAEVEQDMTALAQLDKAMGKTPEVSDLYNRAVWANPSTRDKLLGLQKESEAKRAAAERKAKSEAAQRAAVSTTGSPGSGQAQRRAPGNRSLREELDAAADEIAA